MTRDPLRFCLPASENDALRALASAAEVWGAEWARQGRGGRLLLPVQAGLRQGLLAGEIEARGAGGETEITFRIEHSEYRVHGGSVAVLLFGGVGAILTIVAPLFPAVLWELVPFGVILMLVAWLLVASKLRHKSVEELFALAEEMLDQRADDEAGSVMGATD